MRKLSFIVSIGLAALVAGLNHRLLRPSHVGPSHASASVVAGATGTSPSSTSVAIPVKTPAPHIPATALGEQPKTSSPRIPLEFEANRGQAPDQYAYVAHGPTYSLGLSASEIALSLHRSQAVSQKNAVSPTVDKQAAEKTSVSQLYLRLLGANKTATVA